MRKLLFMLPAFALVLVALVGAGAEARAAMTITVRAGGGEPGYAVNQFLSPQVFIQPGDTVKWTFPWIEPHTVTFGTPAGDPTAPTGGANPTYDGTGFISSGFPTGPDFTYSVTFPKSGTFNYYCAIHPLMTGQVIVRTPDLGQPDNQASVDARSDANYKSALSTLKAAAAGMNAKAGAITPKAGGGKKITVYISTDRDYAEGDVQQYFPPTANIGVNDEVEWVSKVSTPHTVTFIPSNFNPANLPPDVQAFDPFESPVGLNIPADGKYGNPEGYLSTILMGNGWPGGNSFSLTFTKTGTYNYICMLHFDQGMQAKVVVSAQSTAPAPGAPNTGDSATPDGTSGMWLILGSLAILTAAATGAFAVTRR